MKVYAIRGAITVKEDTVEEVTAKSVELMAEIERRNPDISTVVSTIVSTTEDIRSVYPAKAIRESGILSAPIFSCKEPEIEGALKKCIRVLVTVTSDKDYAVARHAYLGEAAALRRDLQ